MPPVNDNFAAAITVSGADGTVAPVVVSDATVEPSEPGYSDLTIWFEWTAPATGEQFFRATGSAGHNEFAESRRVYLYTGSSLATLVPVDPVIDLQPEFSFDVTAGTTYKIQLGAAAFYTLPGGTLGFDWSDTPWDDGGAEPERLARWAVVHLDHDGGFRQEIAPENLRFVLRLGSLGPGEIQYEISTHARQESTVAGEIGDYAVSPDFVLAKQHDFLLKRDDVPLMSGPILEAPSGGATTDELVDHVAISGQDWLVRFQHRLWPHGDDPDDRWNEWHFDSDTGELTGGSRYDGRDVAISQILEDLLAAMVADPNEVEFVGDIDAIAHTINYLIESPDTTFLYDRIVELSAAPDDEGGFEFYVTHDKKFTVRAPEIGSPSSPAFTLEVQATPAMANMLELEYRNSGPEATHVLGVGAGTAERQGGMIVKDEAVAGLYRRWDKVADFSGAPNLDWLTALTNEDLARALEVLEDVPVTVDPRDIPDFWTVCRPGEYVHVVYSFGADGVVDGWHELDTVQKIVEMACTVTVEGEETVQLTLNPPGAKPHRVPTASPVDPAADSGPAVPTPDDLWHFLGRQTQEQLTSIDRRLKTPTHPIYPTVPADPVETQIAFLPDDTPDALASPETTTALPPDAPYYYRNGGWHRFGAGAILGRVGVTAFVASASGSSTPQFSPFPVNTVVFDSYAIGHDDLGVTQSGGYLHLPAGMYLVFCSTTFNPNYTYSDAQLGSWGFNMYRSGGVNVAGIFTNLSPLPAYWLPAVPLVDPYVWLAKDWAVVDNPAADPTLQFRFFIRADMAASDFTFAATLFRTGSSGG